MLARLRCSITPPIAGFAAVKFAPVSFSTRPAFAALVRSTRPAPLMFGSTVALPVSSSTAVLAVVISAERICVGVQVGCVALSSSAEPAMCGVAIEVPDSVP